MKRPSVPDYSLKQTESHSKPYLFPAVRATLVAVLLSTCSAIGQWGPDMWGPDMPSGPVPMVQYVEILQKRWRTIEPELFTPDGSKKYIGTWVELSGEPTSLKNPIILKLPSGNTARLTNVQKADRDELATFHRPPSIVSGRGPITGVDIASHTVTIKAVSTAFEQ